jgi:hypothetical protein
MPTAKLATGISTWYELLGPEAGPRVLYIGGSQTTLTLPAAGGGLAAGVQVRGAKAAVEAKSVSALQKRDGETFTAFEARKAALRGSSAGPLSAKMAPDPYAAMRPYQSREVCERLGLRTGGSHDQRLERLRGGVARVRPHRPLADGGCRVLGYDKSHRRSSH